MTTDSQAGTQEQQTRRFAPAKLNLQRLEILSLQLFLECAARGSISAAAQQCHLSVMAASERLRRLEEALGKVLFFRHRRGLELSGPGLAAVPQAQAILSAFHELVDGVHAAAPSECRQAPNPGRRGASLRLPRRNAATERMSIGLN